MRIVSRILLLTCLILAISCDTKKADTYTEAEIASSSGALNAWFDEQFDADVAQSPQWQTNLGFKTNYGKWDDISSNQMAEELDLAKERLHHLNNDVSIEALDSVTAISYKLYKLNLENTIEDYEYRFYNYPVNQMFGLHTSVPAFLINKHRIDSLSDAKAYIERIRGIKPLFTELQNQLSIRETNQIVPPKFVLDRVLDDSKNILNGKPFEKSAEQMPILADFQSKIEKLKLDEETQNKLIKEASEA